MSDNEQSPKKEINFEESLSELEQIVEKLEHGEQGLEESLKDFERGVKLTRSCQQSLQQAEQRVEQLVKEHGMEQLQVFDTDNEL